MTKNITKTLLLTLGLALLAPLKALAGPAEDSRVRLDSSRAFWYEVRANSTTMMNLYYVGSATQATVTVDANSIDAFAPFATADTGFGTSGSYDTTAAAYDTLGELCDAIDALADYGCELIGAKRDDDSIKLRDRAGAVGDNLKTAGGFDVKSDTGPVVVGAGTPADTNLLSIGLTPASDKHIVLRKCEVNGNVIADWRVYGKSALHSVNSRPNQRKNIVVDDTTEAWREITADDTAESYDFTSASSVSAADGWHFAKGAHVVVRLGEGALGTSTQVAANFVRCLIEER